MTAKAKAKAAPAKKAEKTPMEIGVLAMLRPNTNPFKAIADFGLKTAQVQCWDMSLLNEKFAKETKKQMDDTGVRMAAYWAGYTGRIVWNSYDGPVTCGLVPRDLRARRVDELKRGADFAKMLGAPAIITHCGFIPENPRDELYPETVNAIHEVARHCMEIGLDFWFESGQETPLTLLRTIEDLALPNLGVNLDTANLILYGRGNPVDALDVVGPYVKNLHVKDGVFPANSKVLGQQKALGEGVVDFDKVIKKLYDLNFTGELIIEREISGPQQAIDIRKGITFLSKIVDKYGKKKK
ncbi:MAG: sugar phosphate isomerase/epimerase [Lentisphaeria bacterium]|nr:sugar phosphate isomerase/epimerase [Lentisphaeria bacterium]